jgi:L-ascorbate metabolism protein UlaG (beta-lactamase superfamily)
MRITYHGHSCFTVETASARLVIDPFFSGNPRAEVKAADVRCDYILVSHGHEDHCCDAVEIAKRNDATLVANYEISEFFRAQGAKTHGMNPGGSHAFPFGRVKLTPARHSSSQGGPLQPVYLGEACGIVVMADGRTLYHAGDTALFLDMQLIARGGIDAALLPIGDNFTMGPEDALHALDFLKPKVAVPIHYDTWPVIHQDAARFAADAAGRGHTVKVLKPGGALDV